MAGLEGAQLGSCRILRRIGGGGMGDIYLADQLGLGRQVAIKVVRGESSPVTTDDAREQAHQQFLQEAQAIATLDHPNILPVYEYGEQEGVHYLVMTYMPNGSLADLLVAGTRPGSLALSLPLAPALVTHIVSQTAEALQYAHDHGVIHRDVKPQNLLVRLLHAPAIAPGGPPAHGTSAGEVPPGASLSAASLQILLADFGLARFMALLVGRTGTIGTPLYSAPEQYSGYPVPATDQYALAGIAYLLLTGYYVFNGTVVELHHQHLTVMPTPPTRVNPALPPAIDTMLLRALAKDPAQRFPSVREFAYGLHNALMGASAYPAWPQQIGTGAPSPMAPSPQVPYSLFIPTPQVPAVSPGFVPQGGVDGRAVQTPAGVGGPFVPPLGATAVTPAIHAPTGAPVVSASPSSGVTPSQQPAFIPTTPLSSAPPPYLTPTGPWRAEADAPGAPLPQRPKGVQLPFRRSIQLTRTVLLIGLAAMIVVLSLGGLAVYRLTSGSRPTDSQPGPTLLTGAPGITGQSLQLSRSGIVSISSLHRLNGAVLRAQSALSSLKDLADAGVAHLSTLPALPASVPGLVGNESPDANQQVAVPQLVLAGASQSDAHLKKPMDTSVGASRQFVIEALDGLIHIASVNSTLDTTRSIDSADLFSSVLHSGDVLGAPRVLFDQASGRWLVVYDELAAHGSIMNASYLDIAASQSDSPLAGWNVYQLSTNLLAYGGCTWADYPQIGHDASSYYLTATLFDCGVRGSLRGDVLWEVPQASLHAGSTTHAYRWTGFLNDHQRPVVTLTPAVESDATTTEWLVSNDAGYVDDGATSRTLYVWAIVHLPAARAGSAGGSSGQTIAVVRKSLLIPDPYADPPAAAQRGTSVLLATGDARVSSLVFAGGHVNAAFTTAVNWQGDSRTRSGIYWLDLSPTVHTHSSSQLPALTVEVLQAGIWGFAGGYTMYPAMVADQVGNVVLAASASSASMSASFIFGSRRKSDAANVLEEGHAARLLQSGSSPFIAGEWGDYSSACLLSADASGPETIWLAGFYTDGPSALWRTGLWNLSVGA